MYISQESEQQTRARLGNVLAESEFVVYEQSYAFVEINASRFPEELFPVALAFVRDEDVWSALVPASSPEQEQFVIFGFHFKPDLDNSGFVGWLASHLKARLGTGALVICGQNSLRGGIFDYWGAPWPIGKQVIAEVERLRISGHRDEQVVQAKPLSQVSPRPAPIDVADVILSVPRAREIAEDWVAAWNTRDLERILSHYTDDVLFSSPSVVTRYGEPTGMLRGKHALREHFRRGLETFGVNVRFTIIDVLSGVNGYTVYYLRENGATVVDNVIVNASGKAMQVHAHYRAA